jgi:N-acetyl-anhydromuramyl-L-alanine amidase AmpD
MFGIVCAWAVKMLFFPSAQSVSPSVRTLRPGYEEPDLSILYERIDNTPASESKPEWRPARLKPGWRWIVIHHSATTAGNASAFDRYHRNEKTMENGLAYHFVVNNGNGGEDGSVEVGDRWKKQLPGGHVHGDDLNEQSIGICLVGDFEHFLPSEKQVASLKALINYLTAITPIREESICGHEKMPDQQTLCPGRYLPVKRVVEHRFSGKSR